MKTKNGIWLISLIVMGLVLILTNSCNKDNNNPSTTITDKDGNVYTSVTIGTQIWLVEDLKTTKYLNGDPIPSTLNVTEWYNTTSGACQINSNNIYGNLYNGYAVVDSRKLCPTGWHVSSKTEWETLITYLGGESVAGGKMKEAGTAHWNSPNTGATNESGFTALPVGYSNGGGISNIGISCTWWSATPYDENNNSNSTFVVWNDNASCFGGQYYYQAGFPVRCIKN